MFRICKAKLNKIVKRFMKNAQKPYVNFVKNG